MASCWGRIEERMAACWAACKLHRVNTIRKSQASKACQHRASPRLGGSQCSECWADKNCIGNQHRQRSKERARVYTEGIGDRNKLSPDFAGAMCSSPHRCRPPLLLNTDKGRLCQIRASPDAKQVERHHFYSHLAARRSHSFRNFRFFQLFDSELHGRPSVNIDASFDIQIHIVAHHGRYEAPKLAQTWIPDVAVATSLSPRLDLRRKKLGIYIETQAWPYEVEWVGTGWDAGSGRSDWSDMYDGWMDGWMDG